MGEILGNNSLNKDSPYLNLVSLGPFQDAIRNKQAAVTELQDDLTNATDKADYCEDLSTWQRLRSSCNNRTGKTLNAWRRLRDSLDGQLRTAETALATARKAYNDTIAANKLESEAGIAESEEDIIGQTEFKERVTTVGLSGAIILGLGFAGLFLYKRLKK